MVRVVSGGWWLVGWWLVGWWLVGWWLVVARARACVCVCARGGLRAGGPAKGDVRRARARACAGKQRHEAGPIKSSAVAQPAARARLCVPGAWLFATTAATALRRDEQPGRGLGPAPDVARRDELRGVDAPPVPSNEEDRQQHTRAHTFSPHTAPTTRGGRRGPCAAACVCARVCVCVHVHALGHRHHDGHALCRGHRRLHRVEALAVAKHVLEALPRAWTGTHRQGRRAAGP